MNASPSNALPVVLIPVCGAEILEMGPVAEHVVDGDENGVGHCHRGFARAPATGEAAVASCEEVGVSPAGADGAKRRLDQGAPKPGIAEAGRGVVTLAAALVVTRADTSPRGEVLWAGEASHVGSGLSKDLLGSVPTNARDGVNQV